MSHAEKRAAHGKHAASSTVTFLQRSIPSLSPGSSPSAFPTGPVEAEVKQTPRQLIKARGQKVTLNCTPDSGHNRVLWYQQNLDQGLQFFFEYYLEKQNDKGNVPDRFSAHQFSDYRSELSVSALELEDSAVYLCASSLTQPF